MRSWDLALGKVLRGCCWQKAVPAEAHQLLLLAVLPSLPVMGIVSTVMQEEIDLGIISSSTFELCLSKTCLISHQDIRGSILIFQLAATNLE